MDEINQKEKVKHRWGIDNAMISFLYHTGRLNHINVSVNRISQRMGFEFGGGYIYDPEKKSVVGHDGCSPIMRHKLGGNPEMELD